MFPYGVVIPTGAGVICAVALAKATTRLDKLVLGTPDTTGNNGRSTGPASTVELKGACACIGSTKNDLNGTMGGDGLEEEDGRHS